MFKKQLGKKIKNKKQLVNILSNFSLCQHFFVRHFFTHIQLGMIYQNNVFSPISFQRHLSRLKPPRKDKLLDIFSDTQFHLSYLLSCHLIDSFNLFTCFLVALDLHCCMRAFSNCGKWGLLSSCGAGLPKCRGFSCCGTWALEHKLIVVANGLSCSGACGTFLDQGLNPCLLHWQANSIPLSHQGSLIWV